MGGRGSLPSRARDSSYKNGEGRGEKKKNRNTRWSEERHSGRKRLVLGSPASLVTDVFSSTAIKERRHKDSHWNPVRDDEKPGSETERREGGKRAGCVKKKKQKKQLEQKDCLNSHGCR